MSASRAAMIPQMPLPMPTETYTVLVAAAMRLLFQATHNIAEGAGAAALAGVLQEREAMQGKRVGIVISGGNVDADVFARLLVG